MSKKSKRYNANATGALYKEVRPKTPNQNDYFRSMAENTITICAGPAGTGKTLCSIGLAVEYQFSQRVNHILLSRSIIGCDNDIGLLPGDIRQKTDVYMQSFFEYLRDIIPSEDKMFNMIDKREIWLEPVEILRGRTYHDTFMILDEAQNCTIKQIKMFMSRMGQGSKMVICGDPRQSDIKNNGLSFLLDNLKEMDNIGIVKLGTEDILRSGLIGQILRVFDVNGY